MSIILNGTSESLRVVLSAAPASTQLAATASWADQGTTSGDSAMLTNGTTAVVLVASPAASVSRWVGGVSIYNQDTSAATVTVQKVTGAGSFTLFKARILPGCHIFYDNSQGWRVMDANGNVQTSSNQSPAVPIQGTRNLIVNGDMRINQPVFAGGALAANTYGYDMWRTWTATGSLTLSSDRLSITINGTIGTMCEAPDAAGATVTVSVSNPSGPISISLQSSGTGTGVSGTIPAGSGQQSVTLVVPSSITGDLYVLLTTTSAVTFDGPGKRSGIQVELGSFATAFERRQLVDEMLRCQRFYEKSYDYAIAPGTVSSNGCFAIYAAGLNSDTKISGTVVPFKIMKRTSPSVASYSTITGTVGKVRDVQNGSDVNAGISNTGMGSFFNGALASAASTAYNFQFHWVSDARF